MAIGFAKGSESRRLFQQCADGDKNRASMAYHHLRNKTYLDVHCRHSVRAGVLFPSQGEGLTDCSITRALHRIPQRTNIFRVLGDNKGWSHSEGDSYGNADFLMFSDLDYSHPEVEKDVQGWSVWVVNELQLKGFRFDACPHVSQRFTNEFFANLKVHFGEQRLFLVGEYWTYYVDPLTKYFDQKD